MNSPALVYYWCTNISREIIVPAALVLTLAHTSAYKPGSYSKALRPLANFLLIFCAPLTQVEGTSFILCSSGGYLTNGIRTYLHWWPATASIPVGAPTVLLISTGAPLLVSAVLGGVTFERAWTRLLNCRKKS